MLLRISTFFCDTVQKMTLDHQLLLDPVSEGGISCKESEKTGLRGTPRGLLLPPCLLPDSIKAILDTHL